MRKKFVLDLDGAGYLYPYGSTKDRNTVFRMGVILNQDIDFWAFKDAVKSSYERYPQFFVRFKKTAFNYKICGLHFEDIDFDKMIVTEDKKIAKPFNLDDKTVPAIRFICTGNAVYLECFHAVTDAPGALILLNAVLENYVSLCNSEFVPQVQTKKEFEVETRDVFKDLDKSKTKQKTKITTSSYKFTDMIKDENYQTTKIKFDTKELLAASKAVDMNLGAFVTSCAMYSMLKIKGNDSRKKITILLPVGLRKMVKSTTTRNAALFIELKQPKNCSSYEETLESIRFQMNAKLNWDHLVAIAKQSVSFGYMDLLKILPMVLKKTIMLYIAFISENKRYTTCISNIGKLEFSPKVDEIINEVVFSVQKTQTKGFSTTLMSYGDTTTFELDSSGNIDFLTNEFVNLLKTKVNRVDVEKCEYDY